MYICVCVCASINCITCCCSWNKTFQQAKHIRLVIKHAATRSTCRQTQQTGAQRMQLQRACNSACHFRFLYTHTHTHEHIMCISFTVSISARLHCECGRKNQQEYATLHTHTRTLQTALCVQYPVCLRLCLCLYLCLRHIPVPLPVDHKMYCGHFNIK